MWSNTTSHTVKRLHTDNKGEYIVLELQFYLTVYCLKKHSLLQPISHILQIFTLQLPQLKYMLELFHFNFLFYYTICFSHVVLVSKRGILMCSSFSTHCFLKDILTIPHNLQVYIVVDTIMYLYTLPINYLLFPYLSLCFSCNLNQAWDCNT